MVVDGGLWGSQLSCVLLVLRPQESSVNRPAFARGRPPSRARLIHVSSNLLTRKTNRLFI